MEPQKECCYIVSLIKNFSPDVLNTISLKGLLHDAVENGHIECVKCFIDNGANVNEKNIFGQTPLHRAIYYDFPNCVELLIKHRANVNSLDAEGITPLHEASRCGRVECINLLIRGGAIMNMKDDRGNNALHHLCYGFHNIPRDTFMECMKCLIDSGEDAKSANQSGYTPIQAMPDSLKKEIIDYVDVAESYSVKKCSDEYSDERPDE